MTAPSSAMRATGRGDPGGQHEPGEHAVAGRAVVEEDDVAGLLTAEENPPARISSST